MTNSHNRRSFLRSSSIAVGASLLSTSVFADDLKKIAGFDQTKTDIDALRVWLPGSSRKIRVGIVGFGRCRFGSQFGFQNHPNVEVVAVSDLFPDRCAALAKEVRCNKTYPSLEEMIKDDRIEAVFVATDAPSHVDHCIGCSVIRPYQNAP